MEDKIPSYIELAALASPTETDVISWKRDGGGGRQYSYSDSFLHVPARSAPPTPLEMPLTTFQLKGVDVVKESEWIEKGMSLVLHISLLGVFETLFFFLFISKSEDNGLTGMISNYLDTTLTTCKEWSPGEKVVINDILSAMINATVVRQEGLAAAESRLLYNRTLQIQAWMYIVGLFSVVCLGGVGFYCRGKKIKWKKIVLENLVLIGLLGIYEFMFFKTIIYNYESITLPELDMYIVGELQGQCGLLR
jgi:hypothetical protein